MNLVEIGNTKMYRKVVVVFILTVQLILHADSYCFMTGESQPTGDCNYNDLTIPYGENIEVLEECLLCECVGVSLSCCSIGEQLDVSNAPDCKIIQDGPCYQKAVLIDDESKPCQGLVTGIGR